MITELFFLIMALIITSSSSDVAASSWPSTSGYNFVIGLCIYIFTVAFIVVQAKLLGKMKGFARRLTTLANAELIIFLCVYDLILGSNLIFREIPLVGASLFLPAFFSLSLYFLGLFVAYRVISRPSRSSAFLKVRFLFPFVVPFLFFLTIADVATIFYSGATIFSGEGWHYAFGALMLYVVFLGLLMLFFPVLLKVLWGCRPLPSSPLKERLELLCKKAGFSHGGFKIWHVMKDAITAAIIGIVPRFRYIMFTEKILQHCSDDEVEAILCHEIGHSKRKHLLLYPFIIMGMIIVATLFSFIFDPAIYSFFDNVESSSSWRFVAPIAKTGPFLCIIFLYFRFVFGFFSRMFERQADLHVFSVGIDPENMISSLDTIAILAGGIHNVPSWHHYSIAKRIAFLEIAIADPSIVVRHHRFVRRSIIIYFIALIVGMILVISPFLVDVPVIGYFGECIIKASVAIENFVNPLADF
ncbi:MAG: M48 family metalloprotease [Waddliaceae bacterium]|nr:M48 family metalloprotease [Waddliaceae bacterium]MBT3578425.1 M48 family metalloprotease [Waddliaceae bacterium]MBT6929125.1 M48 family metalloprotease [Waddliaceae bacterium]